jgi:hypothetical protein
MLSASQVKYEDGKTEAVSEKLGPPSVALQLTCNRVRTTEVTSIGARRVIRSADPMNGSTDGWDIARSRYPRISFKPRSSTVCIQRVDASWQAPV